jgi:hypothetical protein
VGSPALGLIAGEDILADTFWDCYKSTMVSDLGDKLLDEESLKPVNAKKMRVKHMTENIRST